VPSDFKSVPLLDQKFMFGILVDCTGDMAESKVEGLSQTEMFEDTEEVVFFDEAPFSCTEIGIQGGRLFGKLVLMLRVVDAYR
jgi:hypothetical protein